MHSKGSSLCLLPLPFLEASGEDSTALDCLASMTTGCWKMAHQLCPRSEHKQYLKSTACATLHICLSALCSKVDQQLSLLEPGGRGITATPPVAAASWSRGRCGHRVDAGKRTRVSFWPLVSSCLTVQSREPEDNQTATVHCLIILALLLATHSVHHAGVGQSLLARNLQSHSQLQATQHLNHPAIVALQTLSSVCWCQWCYQQVNQLPWLIPPASLVDLPLW